MHMKSTADRLFGKDYFLSILAAGRHQFPFVTLGAILGGHVQVGLEDNLYLGRGELAPRMPIRSPRFAVSWRSFR